MASHLDDSAFQRLVSDGVRGADSCVRFGIGADDAVHGAHHNNHTRNTTFDDVVVQLPGQHEVTGRIGKLPIELFCRDGRQVVAKRGVSVVNKDVDAARLLRRLVKGDRRCISIEVIDRRREMTLALRRRQRLCDVLGAGARWRVDWLQPELRDDRPTPAKC